MYFFAFRRALSKLLVQDSAFPSLEKGTTVFTFIETRNIQLLMQDSAPAFPHLEKEIDVFSFR